MANVVIMPKIGITVTECMLTAWHKDVGDSVNKGDILFSYETDKTSIDQESEFSGVLLDRFYEEGEVVECLADVCVIGEPGEKYERKSAAPKKETSQAEASVEPAAAPAVVQETAPAPANAGAPVSPRARTFAKRLGVEDFSGIAPTGPEGRIVAADIEKTAANKPAVSPQAALPKTEGAAATVFCTTYTEKKQSNVRKVIARAMGSSLRDIPQLTLNASFDATSILELRKKFKAAVMTEEFKGITLNDMLVHAVSKVLPDFPALNAHLVQDTLRVFDHVNVGVAVDTDRGLLVPAVTMAETRSLLGISKELKVVVAAAKAGNINPDLLNCGTFTVTNLGSLGVESFTPIINPPQTGILGVDGIIYRMKADQTVYPAMGLSLTFDHRAIDGAPAAKFLQTVCLYLENFELMQMK